MSSVATSLSVGFSPDSGDGELLLENGGGWVGRNSVPLIVRDTLPGNDLRLYCTTGTIVMVGTIVKKQYSGDIVQQQGEDTLEVPEGATYDIKFAIGDIGQTLHPAEVSRVGTTVKFNMKWWGVVAISPYTKDFKLLRYTPNIRTMAGGGEERTYGAVAVIKNGKMATVDAQPPVWGGGQDENEVYRVESKILINKEGEWEMPNGWPDNPTYPNGATPPKPRIGVVSTRVHEVGMVTKTGLFWTRTFGIMPAQPYFGDATYKPATSVVKGKGFEALSDSMKIQAMEYMKDRGKGDYL